MDGARGVLLSVSGGSDLGLFEINEAAQLVADAAHPEANIIFGAVIDDALGDEVRVTVIAAGFDGGGPAKRGEERRLSGLETATSSRPATSNGTSSNGASSYGASTNGAHPSPVGQGPTVQPVQPVRHEPDPVPAPAPAGSGAGAGEGAPRPVFQPTQRPPHTVTFDDADDLDVPDFLK